MGRWLSVLLSVTINNLLLAWGSPATINGFNIDDSNSVNSPSFMTSLNSYSNNGICAKQITVTGKGVNDTFQVPCSKDDMGMLFMLNTDTYLIIGDPKKNPFSLYSDAPSTLVVIEDSKCSKRTYTTKDGTTTSTSTPMTESDCAAVMQTIADEQEKNRIYWEEWSKNFAQHMSDTFPPGFPFVQNPAPVSGSSGYDQSSGSPGNSDEAWGSSSENDDEPWWSSDGSWESSENDYQTPEFFENDGTSGLSGNGYESEGSSVWNSWSNNFAQNLKNTLKKAFPPGFPFHN